jgi:phospholipid/cholesterol/gamma-HCH transport system ATP-binding protein
VNRIEVRDLTMAFGATIVQRHISFAVDPGTIFVIMGTSGCGKSTLLRHMIGLLTPAAGEIRYDGHRFRPAADDGRPSPVERFGVLFQSGALWSSKTLAENVGLPLHYHTDLSEREIAQIARAKLALVGLAGFEDFAPAAISGGMRKRAGLARAIALDPDIVFLDEPSAGLDPLASRRLDELVLNLRDSIGTTFVVVTHELASIFALADDSILLDAVERTSIASGNPKTLLDSSTDPRVRQFLTRGNTERLQ